MSLTKIRSIFCLLGIGAVAVSWYLFFSRNDCEIITYAGDSTERMGDRRLVTVLEDHAIFDRNASQKLLLPLFTDENTFSIMFCNESVLHALAKINLSLLYCFGKRSEEIGALDREPSCLYVIFPTSPPPQKHFVFTAAVVLPLAGTTESYSSQWKQWCVEQNAPYFETDGTDIKAARKGIQIVNEMLVTARKRQSAIDYQKHLETKKN